MPNRFHELLQSLAQQVESEYQEAKEHARAQDPQRAGHEGESTWQRVLTNWGPGWPVVTRKYVVGPGGDSSEVDVLVLKPDYPPHLRSHASILYSGVAAAFSVKLTLRRHHIAEAIGQKKQLLEVAGGLGSTVERVLCGPFPVALLAHSAQIANSHAGAEKGTTGMVEIYDSIAHDPRGPLVTHPSEELDALLIADRCFCSASRMALMPDLVTMNGPLDAWTPRSSFLEHHPEVDLLGSPLVGLITWVNERLSRMMLGNRTGIPERHEALGALGEIFGTSRATGHMRAWPREIYPEHILEHARSLLLDGRGLPIHH